MILGSQTNAVGQVGLLMDAHVDGWFCIPAVERALWEVQQLETGTIASW